MLIFSLAISCLTTSNSIPGSYAILLFTALDFTSITSHIRSWVLFLLWFRLFIFSGVAFPLFPSSLLNTYQPGWLIFQCHLFFPFHTVHGVLKTSILKWFAIPFCNGLHFVKLSTNTHPSWVALHNTACSFIEIDKAVIHVIILVIVIVLFILEALELQS